MKVAIITCYFDPDYVRSLTLRAGLEANPDVELIIIKNKQRGMLRYPEVLLKIIATRLRKRPDVYLLTFRGQEVLPFLLLLAWPKPLLFDEFIVPLAWANQEKHDASPTIRFQRFLSRSTAPLYKWWLRSCRLILTDTAAHADASAVLSGVPRDKYRVLPVGAEENLFKPAAKKTVKAGTFEVFFCGNMRPLYGLEHVLQAALNLKDRDIHFTIVGGKAKAAEQVAAAQAQGAKIGYSAWLPFQELPRAAGAADLCLAGPFGTTPQAAQVITGKTYQFLACAAPTLIGQNEASGEFSNGKDSLVVPRGDSAALEAKILWAYEHRSSLPAIGQAGRQLYDKAFSNQVIATKLQALLNELH